MDIAARCVKNGVVVRTFERFLAQCSYKMQHSCENTRVYSTLLVVGVRPEVLFGLRRFLRVLLAEKDGGRTTTLVSHQYDGRAVVRQVVFCFFFGGEEQRE